MLVCTWYVLNLVVWAQTVVAAAHGGGGVSGDFGLAHAWAAMRTLRFADGPDEVHNRAIARNEFGKYADYKADIASSGDIGVSR